VLTAREDPVRVALLAAGEVGLGVVRRLSVSGDPPCCLVTDVRDPLGADIRDVLRESCELVLTSDDLRTDAGAQRLAQARPDLLVMAWWPYILPGRLLEAAPLGCLNFHPSLLPHGRGKHPNFWALVEGTPFGVTIHHATADVDAGPVAFQRELPVGWTDTGGSLHRRAREAILELFSDSWPRIRVGDIPRTEQPAAGHRTHLEAELEPASRIDLDASYTGRDLLNLLRARTFPPHPGAWFEDDGVRYEARVTIKPRSPETPGPAPTSSAPGRREGPAR
jgi:methionyl-tRNA formyltransferase